MGHEREYMKAALLNVFKASNFIVSPVEIEAALDFAMDKIAEGAAIIELPFVSGDQSITVRCQ